MLWAKADTSNKKINLYKLDARQEQLKTKIYKESHLPEVGVDGQYMRVSNMPVYEDGLFHNPSYFHVIHKMYGINADASFDIYNGNLFKNNLKQRSIIESMSNEKVLQSQNDLHYQIAIYYLDIFRNQEYEKYVHQDIAEREKQLTHIQNLFNKGVVLKSDVLRYEVKLRQQKEFFDELENNIKIDEQNINLLTGSPLDQKIAINLPIQNLEDSIRQTQLNVAEQTHEYQLLNDETRLKEIDLDKAKKSILPKVQLYATNGLNYPQIRFYPYADGTYWVALFGVKASMSISELFRNKKKVQNVHYEMQRNELEKEDFQDHFALEVNKIKIRHQEALDKMEVAKKNIDAAQETFRITQNTYFAQLALLTDLLDAQTHVLETQIDYTTQQVNALLLSFELLKTTGNL